MCSLNLLPKNQLLYKGVMVREILSLMTYLLAWLVCKQVIGIESGLLSLIISLGLAIVVFLLAAGYEVKKDKDEQ